MKIALRIILLLGFGLSGWAPKAAASAVRCANTDLSEDGEIFERSQYLLRILQEARRMSYVSQLRPNVGRGQITSYYPDEVSVLNETEINYIRRRERKFALSDNEIADYYAIKVRTTSIEWQNTLIEKMVDRNISKALGAENKNLSADSRLVISNIFNYLNPNLFRSTYENLEVAREILTAAPRDLTSLQMQTILLARENANGLQDRFEKRRFQNSLISSLTTIGFSPTESNVIAKIVTNETLAELSHWVCCKAGVCEGCGMNRHYNALNRKRLQDQNDKPETPNYDRDQPPPRLFIYFPKPW